MIKHSYLFFYLMFFITSSRCNTLLLYYYIVFVNPLILLFTFRLNRLVINLVYVVHAYNILLSNYLSYLCILSL